MTSDNKTVEQHKRTFSSFLELESYQDKFDEKLKQAITSKKFRFVVDINEIRSFEGDLAQRIIHRPREYIVALQEASIDRCKRIDPSYEKVLKSADLQVGFEGSFGQNYVSPRGLTAQMLNSLVQVEGIVTKCSSVRPKLMRSVQYCPTTKLYSVREYRDNTSIDIGIEVSGGNGERLPTSSIIPSKDANNNPLELEHGLCMYKDYQSIVLQEMPEKSRVGQLPRSVDVILEHDLVDRAKPGDRILCVGVYRSLPSSFNGQVTGSFRTVLLCNNISVIGKEIGAVRLTGNDVKNIRELAQKNDVLDIMARSLCPSIFGHEFIKKALILQLLGGCERNLENGTHLRGDINVMMVGDPSTAKSQLLRSVLDIAPLAISTTGRGSTGVGLTAAVTSDPETGERRLEAGAMVLADRGVVCIDEFDKMGENDRVAIHEVMEQQTVTIAKAGIHASLNARCSVLSAANPVYGQYDKTRRPQENIGLPDSLLSRFDLLFIVLDQLDPKLDRTLSEHVIKSHQYRRPGTIMEPENLNLSKSLNLDDVQDSSVPVDTPMWLKGNRNLNGSSSSGSVEASNKWTNNVSNNELLTKDFLRKYIHYAKNRIQPVLSDDAMEIISTSYANMRSRQSKKNLPITARTLETIIRLSTASAKSRLSVSVDEVDVDMAMELMNFVLFHDIGNEDYNNSSSRGGINTPSVLQSMNNQLLAMGKTQGKQQQQQVSKQNEKENQPPTSAMSVYDEMSHEQQYDDDDDGHDSNGDHNIDDSKMNLDDLENELRERYIPFDVSSTRYLEVASLMSRLLSADMDSISFEQLVSKLNYTIIVSRGDKKTTTTTTRRKDFYSNRELLSILLTLEQNNQIMYNDQTIVLL